MALFVNTKSGLFRTVMPLVTNSVASVFIPPPLTKQVELFKDAGIIYQGAAPDQYTLTMVGNIITQITLNSPLTVTDILEIITYQ